MISTVNPCKVSDLEREPNFALLLDEYSGELISRNAPKFSAQIGMYHAMEDSGVLQAFSAYCDGKLIGFVTVLIAVFPHCGVLLSSTESFFVSKDYRKTGAGTKLRKAAEKFASDRGAPTIFISAPIGGVLAKVLEKDKNYEETNRVFCRRLASD